MTRRVLLCVVVVLVAAAAPAAAQTNPCSAPLSFVVVTANSRLALRVPEYAGVFNGSPLVTEFDVSIFKKGESPTTAVPTSTVRVPKAQWSLVPGSVDCYTHQPAILFNVSANEEYDAYVRARNATEVGGWSNAAPFGRSGPPAAQQTLRIIP